MHVGRDITVPVAFNSMVNYRIVSPAYTVFKVKDEGRLLPLFLFTQLNSKEFDRKLWFNTDGSVRGNLSWEDMCRVKIPLPPIEVQRAYVKAYQGLSTLIEQNEALVKELEKAAQACIIECREKWPMVEIGDFIKETNGTNQGLLFSIDDVRGISIGKNLIRTKADMTGVSLKSYKIVAREEFAFVSVTSRNGEKISLAFNDEGESRIVSSTYVTFKSNDLNLLPEYLFLQFKRPEFDRYARFNSWGSARETFTWDDMCRVKIPLPPIEVQRAIVALYTCAEEARKIATEARELLKKACPAMVQSAAHHKVGAYR